MRATLVVLALALAVGSAAAVGAQPGQPSLYLYASASLRAPARLAAELARPAPGPYAIIQLRGPVSEADRAALAAAGVELLEYLPDFAFLVRGTPDQLGAAARLPQVAARLPFTTADKLAPALLRALATGASLPTLRVTGWPGQAGALARELRQAGLAAEAPASAATLWRIAGLPAARWIEPAGRPRLLNDVARTLVHANAAWLTRGLYGAGQTIAIADSGLDTGDPKTLSPDFAGRLAAMHVLAPGGDLADSFGHGTHVAGSAAGAGVQSGAQPSSRQYQGSFAGVAPEARLVIQAFEVDAEGNVLGLDPDYYTLFAQAYADGARLHSDSWGDTTGPDTDAEAQFGGYPSGARRTDQFVWEHPDMAIFVAAGNSGIDGVPGEPFGFCAGGDGVIDPDSLVSPGTAKNVITVGASESQRESGGASQLLWVYFDLGKFCMSAEPIASDTPSDDPGGIAAFSSRGPTDDGRAKPDLVAPGTNILSNRSHAPGAGTLWGEYAANSNYIYSGGTSMATPLTAGAGALVREWLVARGLAEPSAAAVKAALLNTTVDLAPGQYGTGATREIPAARPNSVEGWGRLDLGFLAAPAPYQIWLDDRAQGLATGQTIEYRSTAQQPLEVLSSDTPLRVLLAWSDPPASLSAARQLVNDLDLTVIGPDGSVYRGNGGTAADRRNNVEGVVIARPAPGQYTVRVRGYNVPVSRQPYALAVSGALPAPALAPSGRQLFVPVIAR